MVFKIIFYRGGMEATDQTEIPDAAESGYQKRKKILTSRRRRAIARHIQTKVKIQNYTPSEDEISQLLKEFTVHFLLNGNWGFIIIVSRKNKLKKFSPLNRLQRSSSSSL